MIADKRGFGYIWLAVDIDRYEHVLAREVYDDIVCDCSIFSLKYEWTRCESSVVDGCKIDCFVNKACFVCLCPSPIRPIDQSKQSKTPRNANAVHDQSSQSQDSPQSPRKNIIIT
jgi:hypothetical protein